jgi:hypothetical protein
MDGPLSAVDMHSLVDASIRSNRKIGQLGLDPCTARSSI